jgi:hypothetical protein
VISGLPEEEEIEGTRINKELNKESTTPGKLCGFKKDIGRNKRMHKTFQVTSLRGTKFSVLLFPPVFLCENESQVLVPSANNFIVFSCLCKNSSVCGSFGAKTSDGCHLISFGF